MALCVVDLHSSSHIYIHVLTSPVTSIKYTKYFICLNKWKKFDSWQQYVRGVRKCNNYVGKVKSSHHVTNTNRSCLQKQMEESNIAFTGGISYFAEHFGHEKYNFIWKMPSVLLSESLAVELEGQEQWPEDVKLYQPYEMFQILLPDSANCLAVQTYLKMNGLKFEVVRRSNAEYMSPSGKVPFIKCGAFVVSELESIVAFVNNKGINISERLDKSEKADMRAYMSLVNNILLNAELYMCWCDENTYQTVTWKRYGSVFPWPLNFIVTWQKRKAVQAKLAVLGWDKKTVDQVVDDVNNCYLSLSERLHGNKYFFGDKPTELDALVHGHLFSILTTQLPGRQLAGKLVENYPNLIDLCKRIEREYFGPPAE